MVFEALVRYLAARRYQPYPGHRRREPAVHAAASVAGPRGCRKAVVSHKDPGHGAQWDLARAG